MVAEITFRGRALSRRGLRLYPLLLALVCTHPAFGTVQLSKAAEEAFNHYSTVTEARIRESQAAGRFLIVDAHPEAKAKVRQGGEIITSRKNQDNGSDVLIPGALLQDWLGVVFIPKVTLTKVRSMMEAYSDYKRMFAPDIIESRVVKHEGDRYDVFLRLYKKQILTVVLNARYDIGYEQPDPKHLMVTSRSTRIAEAKDAKPPYTDEYKPGDDTGFLWRLNSYWRFEEADGGVYAECEAISLSRDVPFGLGWMVGKFVEKFPKESMQNTLRSVQRAVEAR